MSDRYFDPSFTAVGIPEGQAKFQLTDSVAKGTEFAQWIATYQTKIAGVPAADQYLSTYTSMKPIVQKIQQMQDFCNNLYTSFCEHMAKLGASDPGSDDYYTSCTVLIRLLDIVVVINYLKMFNSAIMNDFAMFKRSFQQIRENLPADEVESMAMQSHSLHFFLANPNSVIDGLREEVQKESKLDSTIGAMLRTCLSALVDSESDMSTVELSTTLRAVVYSIYIMDGESNNAFKMKSVKSARSIVKQNDSINVFGELRLTSLVVLQQATHWDSGMEKDWSGEDSSSCMIL